MADGFDIHLDAERAAQLERAAKAAGVAPEVFALSVLDQVLDEGWVEALEALAEYDRTGEYVPAKVAMAEFMRDLDARLIAKGK